MVAERLGLWRLANFELTRLPSPIDVHLFRAVGRNVPDDRRLVVAVRRARPDGRPRRRRPGRAPCPSSSTSSTPAWTPCARPARPTAATPGWTGTGCCSTCGRWWTCRWTSWTPSCSRLAPRTEGLGLEQVLVQFRRHPSGADGEPMELLLRLTRPPGAGLAMRVTEPPPGPLRELDAYAQKVIRARRRGAVYPYELVPMLARNPDPGGAPGTFTEYDLDDTGAPVPGRPAGRAATRPTWCWARSAPPTGRYPEGMRRVVLIGDPTRALGAIAEPECRRVLAALELARRLSTRRSSGSRCPPARRSPWTPAPRTWTGSPGCCAGSSSSPRTAARSTSS